MSKVYILHEINPPYSRTQGVISSERAALQWRDSKDNHSRNFSIFELNNPELLNRIAKESENKNAKS